MASLHLNVLQIPQQYKNLGRQSKDKYEEQHAKLIHELIECDEFDDIATLKVGGTNYGLGRPFFNPSLLA